MPRTITRQPSTVGLARGRILWSIRSNLSCAALAEQGFHAHYIAEVTGLTTGQVYGRCRKLGVGLRDYRNGKTSQAKVVVAKYGVRNMTQRDANSILRDVTSRLEE